MKLQKLLVTTIQVYCQTFMYMQSSMEHDPFILGNSNLIPKSILQYHTPASAYTDKQQLKINCILCHT